MSEVNRSNIDTGALLGGLLPDFWERTPVGLCLSDDSGDIVAVNASFAETTGYGERELVGLPIMRLLAAEGAVLGSAAHIAFIAGEDSATAEMTYLHKSGRPLFFHASDTRLRSRDGRIYRLTTLIDLGRRVAGVPQLRQHQQAETFAALASDISNDFNNLLSIILGYTALLQDSPPDAGRLTTAVGGIDHAVRRAANLIGQTLHLSKREELNFQRVMTGDVVREFFRMASATIGTGLELSLDLSTDLPPVSLDPRQFHQVMTNLAQKARELAGSGGRLTVVNRRVAGTDVRVKFPDAREPAYVELSLRAAPPNGEMVAGERPGTWDAAVRFVEKRRDLSLLVAHNILASHRAHLEIDAWSGPALAFRIYLPALAETETPSGPPVPGPADPGTGERTVLVVDDEDMFLQTLSFLFGRNGFNVIKARDGIEAVAQYVLHADRISLVVIDLGLPHMSGWEAFLKMKERSPQVNALVMSGHLEANLKSEILRAGAKGFLQKPFTMSEALSEVNRLLQPTTPP